MERGNSTMRFNPGKSSKKSRISRQAISKETSTVCQVLQNVRIIHSISDPFWISLTIVYWGYILNRVFEQVGYTWRSISIVKRPFY